MPRMTPMGKEMETGRVPGPGTFEFSGVRPEKLGAAEYTLVTVVVDETGSVVRFADDLLACVRAVVAACSRSPRAGNLLLRLVSFNEKITEIHGFRPLADLAPGDYRPFRPGGMTALYDAAYAAVGATLAYARRLTDQDFDVNAAVYIITDGMDNRSATTPAMTADLIADAVAGEAVESLVSVLIGLQDPGGRPAGDSLTDALDRFARQAGLTGRVDAGQATPEALARLARFVTASIGLQSRALGSGSAAQPLTF